MPLSKEEAIRLGYTIHPVQHSMKRRAPWNDYFMPGRYGVTVHLYTDEEGKMDPALQLSKVVGKCREKNVHVQHLPLGMMVARKIEQIGTHPNYRDVRCVHAVIMPTHIHLTLEILKPLPVVPHGGKALQLTLGHLVGSVKGGCTSLMKHLQKGHFDDCEPGSEEWCRRCDFEYKQWQEFLKENPHLCERHNASQPHERHNTSQLPEGHNTRQPHERHNASQPHEGHNTRQMPEGKKDEQCPLHLSEGEMWEHGYNDKILNTTRKLEEWLYYEDMNPYFWQLETENPLLMQRRLHIHVAMKDDGSLIDFSAFGCIFLLRKGDRIQVQCTRLAEKGMLTQEEWQHFSQPAQVRKFESERVANPLGGYRHDWLHSLDPTCKTPIPYELTEHFRKYKDSILAKVRTGVIPVSPAVSRGEQDIFYTAADEGWPVIKLSKTVFSPRMHPAKRDRILCSQGQMLVLGPWDMPRYEHRQRNGEKIDKTTDRAIFQDLNMLAKKMCEAIGSMRLKEQLEEMDLSTTDEQKK